MVPGLLLQHPQAVPDFDELLGVGASGGLQLGDFRLVAGDGCLLISAGRGCAMGLVARRGVRNNAQQEI